MSGFTPLTRAQFRTILVNQFQVSLSNANISLDQIPDTGPDSVMGAAFDALSQLAMQLQYQAQVYQLASRLSTTPANSDGTVSTDAASFTAPFGVFPVAGAYASSTQFNLNLQSPSATSITVPCGLTILRGDGIQYVLIADTTQSAYNGDQGYTFPANTTTIAATFVCLTVGTVGNVANPSSTTFTVYGGPGSIVNTAIGSVSLGAAITNGTNSEQQAEFASRFTTTMQNGQYGVSTAIIAKALGVQAGLTVSYGNNIQPNGTPQAAFFSLIVGLIGTGTAPTSILIQQIITAVTPVVAGGIEFTIVPATLSTPTITGNVAVQSGFSQAGVTAAVAAAVQAIVNNIGLNQAGGTTTLSYAQTLAAMIAVPGVNPVGTTLQLNSGTADVVAPFATQLVCPTPPSFSSSG